MAWGRCREGAGAPAYWPWRQALRAYAAGRPPEDVAAELGQQVAELGQLLSYPTWRALRGRLPSWIPRWPGSACSTP